MSHSRYLTSFILVFALVCALAGTFNFFVDPYGLFGIPPWNGFNTLKPKAGERVRITKPYQVLRHQQQTLIGGNSRPEMGLDPDSPCWNDTDRPIYNMGTPGASLYMQTRYLQHAMDAGAVSRVLLGLDLLDFLTYPSGPENFASWPEQRPAFESRLIQDANHRPNPEFWLTRSQEFLKGLFSFQGSIDSLGTLLAQRNPNSSTRRNDGFNPARDYLDIIATEGQEVLFRQKNREVITRIMNPELGIFQNDKNWSTDLEALQRFLRDARSRGVEVTLFINPYHAEYLTSLAVAGKWPTFMTWKRAVVAVAGRFEIPLWDFSGFDPYSTEELSVASETGGVLQWFWEPAHYRRELGELMLARMLERDCGKTLDMDFGKRISESTLETRIDQDNTGLARFQQEQPHVWAKLQDITESLK